MRSRACLAHCQFIKGPEVRALEAELAAFCGARHAIACSSGTDALLLVLMAWEIGPGDAVICPGFHLLRDRRSGGAASARRRSLPTSTPTRSISIRRAASARWRPRRQLGLKPRAIIPVDLFGLPADHDAIAAIAAAHGLFVLDDAAQSFGATYRGRKLGALATATATSFFPAKPLGCYGDGGAMFTDDDDLAARLRSLRVHGEGTDKYDAARIGITGRLDTIQAAMLLEKLKIFPEEIAARNAVAQRYARALPMSPRCRVSATNRPRSGRNTPSGSRPDGAMRLPPRSRRRASRPRSITPSRCIARPPIAAFPVADGGLPVSERLAEEVISLPMHAYLDEPAQDRIIAAVRGRCDGLPRNCRRRGLSGFAAIRQ